MISARYTWAKTTSDTPLGLTALNTNGVYNNTLPDTTNFNGENVNQSFQLAWTAIPAANWNTRVYYYWTKLDNKSDVVEFGNAPAQPLASGLGCGNLVVAGVPTQTVGNCENELYNYTKNNVGFDAWWRFARGQRLGFGYDYLNIDQTRVDYDKSHTNKLWVEYKNTMFDTLVGAAEVPVPEARLGCSTSATTRFPTEARTTRTTCCRSRPRSTCRATPRTW